VVCQEPSTEWYCDPKNRFCFFDYFKEIGGNRVKSDVWTERSTEILIFSKTKIAKIEIRFLEPKPIPKMIAKLIPKLTQKQIQKQ